MSTPSNHNNPHAPQPKPAASTGPSTPAAAAHTAPANGAANTGLASQSNAGTPRSNPPTMHPSPANHRSPLNIRSPAAARSLGGTPMMRAASANAYSTGHGATPSQRAHASLNSKAAGTPPAARSSLLAGKTLPGSSGLAASQGLGIVGQPSLSGASPNLNAASPSLGASPRNNNALGSLATFNSPVPTTGAPGTSTTGLPGAVDMDISFSGLGFSVGSAMSAVGSSGGSVRIDDEEKRRRLESVLDTLRQRPGRISREAIERLGRRCELDMQMDEDELSLAGKNAVMLEIQFKPNKSNLVERVAVAFPTASDTLAVHADKASKILLHDLSPPSGIATINASLDRFADNLERLSRLDKLSVSGANCFEAVFGVYTSLRKLYDHERKIAETIGFDKPTTTDADTEVMCKRSGKPEMHAQGRVGLSLQYWRHRRLVPSAGQHDYSIPPVKEEDKMDVDDINVDNQDSFMASIGSSNIASITIECEASSPALYPSIRITDAWLSERVNETMEAATNGEHNSENATGAAAKQTDQNTIIEWEEPALPFIPTVEPDPMSAIASTHHTQPQARFVAKFEPAVVMPAEIAAQIYASVEVNIMQENLIPSPLESLMLPSSVMNSASAARGNSALLSAEPIQSRVRRAVTSYDTQNQITVHDWDIRLYPLRMESAVQMRQLPFSHPRQIVAMLPILRQYTFLTKLLQNTFVVTSTERKPDSLKESSSGSKDHAKMASSQNEDNLYAQGAFAPSAAEDLLTTEAEFAAFLSELDTDSKTAPRKIDISLSLRSADHASDPTAPVFRSPHLTVLVPGVHLPGTSSDADRDAATRISFTILPSADVDIELHDLEGPNTLQSIALNGNVENGKDLNMETQLATQVSQEVKMEEDQPDLSEHQNGSQDGATKESKAKHQKIKDAVLQALLISEDLAVWAEWLRARFPSKPKQSNIPGVIPQT